MLFLGGEWWGGDGFPTELSLVVTWRELKVTQDVSHCLCTVVKSALSCQRLYCLAGNFEHVDL